MSMLRTSSHLEKVAEKLLEDACAHVHVQRRQRVVKQIHLRLLQIRAACQRHPRTLTSTEHNPLLAHQRAVTRRAQLCHITPQLARLQHRRVPVGVEGLATYYVVAQRA
jgi:hypothetical protein